ncbi:hypothetical protein H9P43_002998 [Blastocladiella emersonii ATCC 22665]|nr:hypothetical protein H9P43_002998 [Blastocladiella emersonii ATCC 22665]
MASKMALRILRELNDIERNPDVQFHLSYNEDDVTTVLAMITGSPDTAYAFGQFVFRFTFPSNYPTESPKVVAETTNQGRTRFNPNIYGNGKVCLSILGTWPGQPSENWNSAHGILSVLISIQSLMGERPYENEPGFERNRTRSDPNHTKKSDLYNLKIKHETIRISVCDRLESFFGTAASARREFEDVSKYLFMCYYRRYLQIVETESKKVTVGQRFERMAFENSGNIMEGDFSYPDLEQRLKRLFTRVNEETTQWIAESKTDDWSGSSILTYSQLQSQFNQVINSKLFDGQLDLELEDGNPYVWITTIFGRPGTNYEGGIFRVRFVFHKDFPTIRPRVCFITPFYHPNVSQDGFPIYRVERMDDPKSHLQAIVDFFTADPSSDPTSHLDSEIARLYFGTKEERREFGRNARRCANRSVEYM